MTDAPRRLLMLAPETVLVEEGPVVRIRRGEHEVTIPDSASEPRALWHALSRGLDAGERRLLYGSLPPRSRLEILALLDALRRGAWLVEQLRSAERVLLTHTVISDWYEPVPAEPGRAYVLSRFALLRHLHPDGLLLESPRCHARVVLSADAVARCAAVLVRGVEAGWDAEVQTDALIRVLVESALLIPRLPDGTTAEDQEPTLRGWDFHDLLFHARSRSGRHRDPYGRVELLDDPLPTADPVARERTALPVPDLDEIVRSDPPFGLVLERRRTVRAVPPVALTAAVLGEFLFRSARIQRSDDASPAGAWRPFASAAGLNELVIYLNVRHCVGVEPGLYRYDPLDHALEWVEAPRGTGERLTRYCGSVPIGVHVIIAARFGRMNRRYRSLAYSLLLRNAGCLLQTMYLVATALGRAPCAVGAGDADLFARVTGLPYEAQGPVADFVLR